ncbi:THxN family PEP-CTERM protein [Sandaracinobacter neustonicus]|uniref:THxN family PEP-CTERM protein n=1 Tax=Sandaracinobacter neustonicus TaxID=1715348 RepID=UPI0015E2D9F4|nr:THxN family PEP-CTERM protein [Sandaracinobacter neustonicus]
MRFILAAAAIAVAGPASAAIVTFENITGTWSNPIGGSNISYSGNGTDDASIRWGNSTGQGKSGYDFEEISIPGLTVNPPAGSDLATIGLFRHVNQPITGNAISGVTLTFTTDVKLDGTYLDTVNFVYNFKHTETPNDARPCQFGGANGFGVNSNGCADRVLVNFNSQSDSFVIDGKHYALDIVGFLVGGDPATAFLTKEKRVNEAYLQGRVVLYSDLVDGVPEPATWAMLIAGFGLVGAAARRRERLALQTA